MNRPIDTNFFIWLGLIVFFPIGWFGCIQLFFTAYRHPYSNIAAGKLKKPMALFYYGAAIIGIPVAWIVLLISGFDRYFR